MKPIRRRVRDLLTRCEGIAMTEFALALPAFIILLVGGIEVANYMTVRMRISQLALHVADHGARIGSGTQLQAQQISEAQINDMFTGVNLQAGGLAVGTAGKVIVSSLEPDPANAGKFKIVWQRCFGTEPHTALYGRQGDNNLAGMGPAGNQVTAMADGATIFVELNYRYKPLFKTDVVKFGEFTEIAAMTVRDKRDLTRIYNAEGVTPSNCT